MLVLLGAIYRSPVIVVIPLLVLGFAYSVAQGLIYLYANSGATVSTNSTQILVVLLFGVGTDYCLLLVSRYREELHLVEDKHEAMARRPEPVRAGDPRERHDGVLAMLVLLVAETGSVHSLGPVCAIGVACVLLAGLTLLPALLTIFGRAGSGRASGPWHSTRTARSSGAAGLWRRLGDSVLHRPGLGAGVTVALFGLGALGLLAYKEDYCTNGFFKKKHRGRGRLQADREVIPGGHARARPPCCPARRTGR